MSFSNRLSRSAKKLIPDRVRNLVAEHQLRQAHRNWDKAMAQAAPAPRAARSEAEDISYMQRRCTTVQTFFESRYDLKFEKSVGDGNHGATGVFRATKPRPALRRVPATLGPRPAGVGSRAASTSSSSSSSSVGAGEKSTGTEHFDKYLIKFSLGSAGKDESDAHLRNEARWLRVFNGSEHFIRFCNISYLLAQGAAEQEAAEDHDPVHDKVLTVEEHESFRGMIPVANGFDGSGTKRWIACLILEYLPLGDLGTLRNRFNDASIHHGVRPPVRLLWGLALCRMAYPDALEPGTREKIPTTGTPGTLVHNSLKGPNMLLDLLHPTDSEHEITPLIKLIDFGRTGYKPPDNDLPYSDGPGVYRNLHFIGSETIQSALIKALADALSYQPATLVTSPILSTLACPELPLKRGCSWINHDQLWEWWGPGQGRPRLLMATYANKTFCNNVEISYDFRQFVGQLMSAVEEPYHTRVRPTLQQALARCQNGCNQGPHEEAPETPEEVQHYVKYVVLGAMPPQEPPPPPSEPVRPVAGRFVEMF